VIVHRLVPPDAMLTGAQASDDTLVAGVTLTIAVVLPPSVAVTVTDCGVATEPAVAANVVKLAPAGTVMVGGIGNAPALSDARVTMLPPAGAGCVRVIVHVVAAPDVTLAGAQTSADTLGSGVTVTVAVALPPSVAVTVTV